MQRLYVGRQTCVVVHEVHLRTSEMADVRYITSAPGKVELLTLEMDNEKKSVKVTLDIKLFPFPKHMRHALPLFKHMRPEPEHPDRTIYTLKTGEVFVRINQAFEFSDGPDGETHEEALISGVVLGQRCKDSCRKRCYLHNIPQPYSWVK